MSECQGTPCSKQARNLKFKFESSCGHLNSLSKLALLKAYLSVERFDIFCISETLRYVSDMHLFQKICTHTTEDDDNLQIPGYDLIRSDHPSNSKRGGVAIYYKNFLPLKLIDVNYLSESILFQLQLGSKICNFISFYRSPSQTADNFDSFLDSIWN